MSKLVGFKDLPSEVAEEINAVVKIWKEHMGEKLVGVYLHGSIVLNAFRVETSDIDILIVVKDPIHTEQRLAIAKDIIAIDKSPCPLEMSAIQLCEAQNWKNPGNCVFHYSDYWTERYQKKLADPTEECYVADHDFPDADVTSYIKLIRQCGIVLYGAEIDKVFANVSDEDFWAAISAEVDEYDFYDYGPRYLASNILILGRILSFKKTKKILSKYDGGLWMTDHVPERLRYIPENAMKIWFEGEQHEFTEEDLNELREYLVEEIKK